MEGQFWCRVGGHHDGHNRSLGAGAFHEELVARHVWQVIIQDGECRGILLQPLQSRCSRERHIDRIPMGFQGTTEQRRERVAVLDNEGMERGLGCTASQQLTHMGA